MWEHTVYRKLSSRKHYWKFHSSRLLHLRATHVLIPTALSSKCFDGNWLRFALQDGKGKFGALKSCVQNHKSSQETGPKLHPITPCRGKCSCLPGTRVLFVSESRGAFGTPKPKRNTSSPTNQEPAHPASGSLDLHSSCAQAKDNGPGAQFPRFSQPRCRPCGYQTRKVSSPLSQSGTERHYQESATDRQRDRTQTSKKNHRS